jgi:uncharacterized phage-associated protein
MKSPFTGGEARLMREPRELVFRKEKFAYVAHYYLCEDTQEEFTTTGLDELNINQVYNQYRVKYGIPFPDEISDIRDCYGLSAAKMSEILGLGANQYRLYENGEMPSEAIGKLLKSIMSPKVFVGYINNSENQFSASDFRKIIEKVERRIRQIDGDQKYRGIFDSYNRSEVNGYAPQSYDKLKNIILYFIDKCEGVFTTKMNKLLFYADFLSYKSRGVGISGLAYKAIQYGPVPSQWDVVYGLMDDINHEIIEFPSGNSGEILFSEMQPDLNLFSEGEINTLDAVLRRFKNHTANDISQTSHQEDAWKNYIGTKELIDYTEAFALKAL